MDNEPLENESELDEIQNEDNPVNKETVQQWVKEALADFLGSESPTEQKKEKPIEHLTLKDIERASREAVEAAMTPLRQTLEQKTKPKAKPKEKPTPEPEPTPSAGEAVNKLRTWFWGAE